MRNKIKANLTLATSAILAAGTLPFANSGIIFGLLNHGFIAATIGGLADWFAVTALFHKPLGISYRTEILKRNRQHITDAIIEFVSEDLLSSKNIMDAVNKENSAKLLIDFFEQNQGRRKLKDLTVDILIELFKEIDSAKVAGEVAPIVESEIRKFDATKIFDAAVKVVTADKHSRKILITLLETGQKIIKSKHMQAAIYQKIIELRQAYEGDSTGRALVLASMNLTDEKILSILNENVETKITETVAALKNKNISNDTAQDLINSFERAVKSAVSGVDTAKFQAEFENLFSGKINMSGYLQGWIENNVNRDRIWQSSVDNFIDAKVDSFIGDKDLQGKFDALVKSNIAKLVEEYHDEIPALIRERLNKFDDDMLTEFVESRVADDLQMIRINGSVCGAVVGMALYLIALVIGNIG